MPDTLPRDGGYPARVALAPGRIVIGAEEGSSGGRRQDTCREILGIVMGNLSLQLLAIIQANLAYGS